jgi:hypothetical protein
MRPVQVLTEWGIPFLAITDPKATEEDLSKQWQAMETKPKVILASISCMAEEEIQCFLRKQPVVIISIDEAQACIH